MDLELEDQIFQVKEIIFPLHPSMQIQRGIKYFTEAQIYQKFLFWGSENFTNYLGSKYFDIFGSGELKMGVHFA